VGDQQVEVTGADQSVPVRGLKVQEGKGDIGVMLAELGERLRDERLPGTGERKYLWDNYRLAVEHGGATALAALLTGAYRPAQGERVAVVVCGANTDPATLT
jgi:hypothetical protein